MSSGLILGALVFVDLAVVFLVLWSLSHGQGLPLNTVLMAVLINVVGVMALRSLRK